MAGTRLYFRNILVPTSQLDTKQATNLPAGASYNSAVQPRWMYDAAPLATNANTSLTASTLANTSEQSGLLGVFVSRPLAAGTIAAENWVIAVGVQESNASANQFLAASIYVWRPSTGAKVGTIYDAATDLLTEVSTSQLTSGRIATVPGSAVAHAAGDVIVCEIWTHGTQSSATSYTMTLHFGGTTDVTEGGSGRGSYIEPATQALAFSAVRRTFGTLLYPSNSAAFAGPGTTEQSTTYPRGGVTLEDATIDEKLLGPTNDGSATTLTGVAYAINGEARDEFFTSFSTAALAAQTIPAQEWTFGCATGRTGAGIATAAAAIVLYVWRTGVGKVGTIVDDAAGAALGATRQHAFRFSGASVAVQAGDFLVAEVYSRVVHAANTNNHAPTLIIGDTGSPFAADSDTGPAAGDRSAWLMSEFALAEPPAVLVVADALHGHAAESPTLTQAHVLAATDALHAHAAESPALTQANIIAVADALHAHAVEAPALIQANLLAVADALHAHAVDGLTLTQQAQLIVQDALHAHLADSPTLVVPPPPFPTVTGQTTLVLSADVSTLVLSSDVSTLEVNYAP